MVDTLLLTKPNQIANKSSRNFNGVLGFINKPKIPLRFPSAPSGILFDGIIGIEKIQMFF